MKKVIKPSKKVFLMVALMAMVMGYANEPSFYISKEDAPRTTLTFKNVKAGNLFTIKDENGMIVYKELIKQAGLYKKGFDLTSLPNGDYFFELNKYSEITTIPFSVNQNEVFFKKELKKSIFKPITRVKDGLVLVTKLSLNKAPLKIDIYSEGGAYNDGYQLVHSETIENTKNIERAYKLTDSDQGGYKIVYTTEGREFVEFI